MHGSGEGTKSTVKVFGNIFISFIGAGAWGLPFAFKEAGILEGIMIMATVGYLSVCAMMLLIDCKDQMLKKSFHTNGNASYDISMEDEQRSGLLNGDIEMESFHESNNKSTTTDKVSKDKGKPDIGYGDVGLFAFGRKGAALVEAAIVVSQIGFCCAYLIFITENVAQYISRSQNVDMQQDDTALAPGSSMQKWILLAILFPLCALCFLRHLHKLRIFSLFADFANVFAYSIVFWFDFEHAHQVRIHPKEMDISGFPFFAGMAVYCYEGAGMILSLESSMAVEVRSGFRTIFKWAMLMITTLYIVFGVCGYLSFGPETNPIITLNLPPGIFPLLVKLCLCCSLFFTYPVMMFPVIQILQKKWKPMATSMLLGNILRAGMVTITGLIVLVIPSFSNLMSLVGATCCSLLAFILPALFHLKVFKTDLTLRQKILDYILICTGVCATIIGTVDSLQRIGLIQSDTVENNVTRSNVTMT
ncbi:LOW QUALITY PROTEIN: uncharacterized protein LOC100183303 [Ciona intestinalis]